MEEIVSIRTTYPYQTLQIHDKDGDLVMDLWVAYVPLGSDQLGTQTFGLLSVKKPKWGFLLDMAWPVLGIFTHRIFEEDREIVELEQKAWRELGGDHNIEVFPIVKALRALLAVKACPTQTPNPSTRADNPHFCLARASENRHIGIAWPRPGLRTRSHTPSGALNSKGAVLRGGLTR